MSLLFSSVLSPLALRSRAAPSRIVFASHRTNFAVHNCFSARHAAYYTTRAQGGAGVIVLEGSVVHPSDWPYEYAIFGYDPSIVKGYQMVGEATHRHGTLVLAHLTHSGGQGTSHYSQHELWAPSAVQEVSSRETPKVMEVEDIHAVTEGFARSAHYAKAAGLDGVEINAGQHSLLRQFLSPMTNHRTDHYGGELENRLRLTREVISAVREELGKEAIIGLRLCGDEYAPWAGLKPEDAVSIARELAGGGRIDFLSVTSGGIYSPHLTRAGLYRAPGYAAPLAFAIKAAVVIPVVAQGSIVDAEMVEELVAGGKVDAVEMTRALIADANLPALLRDGHREEIRPCILCNQGCMVDSVQNPPLSCAVNPAAGYELEDEFGAFKVSEVPRQVMVIGGGPTGLEAARVSAMGGHRVTLFEREADLGGVLRLASAAPGRERLALVVRWLEAQIRKLGVTIKAGVEVTSETVREAAPDAVIVATGARPGSPSRFQSNGLRVIGPRQVLGGEAPQTAGSAIILDGKGDQVGMAVAEWLAERGWRVGIVTVDLYAGPGLTSTSELIPWYERAHAKGIAFHPQVEADHVTGRSLIAFERFGRSEVRIADIDLIVDVSHELPEQELYFELKEAGFKVLRAGDCVAPRNLGRALLEGYRAGRSVG